MEIIKSSFQFPYSNEADPNFETTIQNYIIWLMVKNRLPNMGKKYSSASLPFREVLSRPKKKQKGVLGNFLLIQMIRMITLFFLYLIHSVVKLISLIRLIRLYPWAI